MSYKLWAFRVGKLWLTNDLYQISFPRSSKTLNSKFFTPKLNKILKRTEICDYIATRYTIRHNKCYSGFVKWIKSPHKDYIHDPTFRHYGLVFHQGWSDVETHDFIYCQGDVIYQQDVNINILVVNNFRHPYLRQRARIDIFISMSWFTINNSFQLPISSSLNTSIQKGQLPISLTFYGELYRRLNWIRMLQKNNNLIFRNCRDHIINKSLPEQRANRTVVRALCSTSSVLTLWGNFPRFLLFLWGWY